MTIETLKQAVRTLGSVITELVDELDALQDKHDELKKDERRYCEWWNDETKKTDKLKAILEKNGIAFESTETDESD